MVTKRWQGHATVWRSTSRDDNLRHTSPINLYFRNEDVLFNPQNPVNPDSKPGVAGEINIETYQGEDARHRVSTGQPSQLVRKSDLVRRPTQGHSPAIFVTRHRQVSHPIWSESLSSSDVLHHIRVIAPPSSYPRHLHFISLKWTGFGKFLMLLLIFAPSEM